MLGAAAPEEAAYVMFNNMPRVTDAKRFLRLLDGESRART
jgi:uncharacterized protein YecE (DUF72 family)